MTPSHPKSEPLKQSQDLDTPWAEIFFKSFPYLMFFTEIWMFYATSEIQFRILCFVNKAWTCFCLHIFVILVNNSFKSCFSVFIKCVINTMTQFILLVISHLFKIWFYSIHVLIAKKKYTVHVPLHNRCFQNKDLQTVLLLSWLLTFKCWPF